MYIHERKIRTGFEQVREKIIQINGFQTHEKKLNLTHTYKKMKNKTKRMVSTYQTSRN